MKGSPSENQCWFKPERTQRGGVLIFISLIRQMARGTNEGEMDEAAAENVNQLRSLS